MNKSAMNFIAAAFGLTLAFSSSSRSQEIQQEVLGQNLNSDQSQSLARQEDMKSRCNGLWQSFGASEKYDSYTKLIDAGTGKILDPVTLIDDFGAALISTYGVILEDKNSTAACVFEYGLGYRGILLHTFNLEVGEDRNRYREVIDYFRSLNCCKPDFY